MQTETRFENLVAGDAINARATDSDVGIAELAAQIKAKGLIQPLVVREAGDGKFQIIAGNRRHRAISELIKSSDWDADKPIAITVRVEDDAAALETSLIENIGRLPMHAVDQFEAFASLAASGMTVTDIAARFGVKQKTVKQRLVLGQLSPIIRAAWRAGKISAENAQAFTICRDQDLQAKTFEQLKKSRRLWDHSIREAMIDDSHSTNSGIVKFVGLKAYKAAGGKIIDSLFESDRYIADGALLKSLAHDKLDAECRRLMQDDWSWAELADNLPDAWRYWARVPAKENYTADERARLKEIEEEIDKISCKEGDWTDEDQKTEDDLYAQTGAIEEAAEARGYSDDVKAKSGCVVDLSGVGLIIDYGVVRDTKKLPKELRAQDEVDKASEGDIPKSDISGPLLRSITETLTIASARTLCAEPGLALRVAVAALTSSSPSYCLPVKMQCEGYVANSAAPRATDPDDDVEFRSRLDALKGQADEDVAKQFAACVAEALDLRLHHTSSRLGEDCEALISSLPASDYLASARELFLPADYFSRAPARVAIAALAEMGGPEVKAGAKKPALVKLASDRASETGWLPPELRHPEYALYDAAAGGKSGDAGQGGGERSAA